MSVTDTAPVRRVTVRTSVRTRSIWLWQLSLAAVVITLALSILVLKPDALGALSTAIGVVTTLALTVIALVIPWDRIGRGGAAVLPFADIIAIGRKMLFDPFWAHHAAEALGQTGAFDAWPKPYGWWLDKWSTGLKASGERPSA